MAIEKTVFTGTTQAANAPEVYAFLNANKEGYFDSVEMDETSHNITCYVGETPAITLGFDGTAKNIKITLANGVVYSAYPTTNLWRYAVKTSKGLVLVMDYNSLFITKSSADTTAILFAGQESSSTAGLYYKCADIVRSTAMFRFLYPSSDSITVTEFTAFVPIPLGANIESYTSDVYFTPYVQYKNGTSKLTSNGREYYYSDYIALGD
jgi:hypothetical protein